MDVIYTNIFHSKTYQDWGFWCENINHLATPIADELSVQNAFVLIASNLFWDFGTKYFFGF
jgi:hypothetical protein